MKRVTLASLSPRRSQLLSQCGISHTVLDTGNDAVEENAPPPGDDLGAWVEGAAAAKLHSALSRYAGEDSIIICADTVVECGGKLLGKPSSAEDAKRMLGMLSGRRHSVLTGVALHDTADGRECVFHERTYVDFREMSGEEIDRYVATGEPMDKAGAYGIQGLAGAFVSGVEGCYPNVVGLPVGRLVYILGTEFGYDATLNW